MTFSFPDMGEITLAKFDLSFVSHLLSSRDRKSSDKIINSLELPASLKS